MITAYSKLKVLVGVLAFFAIGYSPAFAQTSSSLAAARSELAPTGKLRVGLPVTNPVAVTKDGSADEMEGIAADLARAFAKRLGVAFEPVRYRTVTALFEGAKAGEYDVAFLGYNAERMTDLALAGLHVELGETYLVPQASQIRNVADADRPGHRIAAIPRSLADQHLSKHLRDATVIHIKLYSSGIGLMSEGKADAMAGNHATLSSWAAKQPEFRVVDGSLFRVAHALAVIKGRPAGLAYAKEFIEYAKASGLVQQVIDQSGLSGVTVAPASAQ